MNKKLSTNFLKKKLNETLKELEKLSYAFASNIPKSEPIFIQEVDMAEIWWQVEMIYLEAWSSQNTEYLIFAVDIRDGYVRLGSVIIYSANEKPEIKIDQEVCVNYPRNS